MTKKFGVVVNNYDGRDTPKEILETMGRNFDRFGEPNKNMLRVLETLGRDFTIVFITGRWAMGQEKVEAHLNSLLPNINKKVFCKPHDYPATTAEYKLAKIKELELQGYDFHLGFDDHSAVIGYMHNHGMFVAHVITD
ncbi:MAG: HAD family acid phosphatase [Rickettsiales bacterium]|nr:HAD family acid phosphatase [Rickettsiales bacterium]